MLQHHLARFSQIDRHRYLSLSLLIIGIFCQAASLLESKQTSSDCLKVLSKTQTQAFTHKYIQNHTHISELSTPLNNVLAIARLSFKWLVSSVFKPRWHFQLTYHVQSLCIWYENCPLFLRYVWGTFKEISPVFLCDVCNWFVSYLNKELQTILTLYRHWSLSAEKYLYPPNLTFRVFQIPSIFDVVSLRQD